jgi:hypothetical protein
MALLDELKDNLGITGAAQDAALTRIIARGMVRIDELAGAEQDYDADGLHRDLLLDFCRYAFNNATEYFEENFAKEILRMSLQSAVSADATE